jgi:hypothetical protein
MLINFVFCLAVIRGFITKKQYAALKEQRVGLQVIQRTLRAYMKNKKWPWFNVMQVRVLV